MRLYYVAVGYAREATQASERDTPIGAMLQFAGFHGIQLVYALLLGETGPLNRCPLHCSVKYPEHNDKVEHEEMDLDLIVPGAEDQRWHRRSCRQAIGKVDSACRPWTDDQIYYHAENSTNHAREPYRLHVYCKYDELSVALHMAVYGGPSP